MQPLTAQEIRGTWGTVLLPLKADDSIDYTRLREQVERLTAAGLDGVYTNGTTGEFYAQTEDEFDQVSQVVACACERARIPFQIGVSHSSAQISLGRLQRAIQLNPCAIQVILPDWLPVSNQEAVTFLGRLAEKAGAIPIVLYNPPHAKRVLEPRAYSELKRAVPQLIGIKVSDGDSRWYASIRENAAGLSVFVPGHHLATGIREGAHGSYSNIACLNPVGAKRWYRLMQTNLDRALEIEARIRQFFSDYIQPLHLRDGYSSAALDKLLAAIGGWASVGTRLRWPYRWIPEDAVPCLRRAAQKSIPELFEEQDACR